MTRILFVCHLYIGSWHGKMAIVHRFMLLIIIVGLHTNALHQFSFVERYSSRLQSIRSSPSSPSSRSPSCTPPQQPPLPLPPLKFYNSLTRNKQPFTSLTPNKVKLYTCGPTVYDVAHIGNFRAFLTYDLTKRVLRLFNYDVDHVCNLTDVDDKIIKKCNALSVSLKTLTNKYVDLFFEDLDSLNIIKARAYPRATEEIASMVQMVEDLAEKGLAYRSPEGSWYFNVKKQSGYGKKLVDLNLEADYDQNSDQNIDSDDLNSGLRDFALWKAYKPDADREDGVWDTSIGRGRPGWHLECSAMAKKYLGDEIDIHCGGTDLKFPHHENEIAQTEGVTGKQFCGCWLHNGFVNVDDTKMSKSLGNFLTLRSACKSAVDVRAFRFLVISTQYRSPMTFSGEVMASSKVALLRLDKLRLSLQRFSSIASAGAGAGKITPLTKLILFEKGNFISALADDMSTPKATAVLFNVVKAAEKEIKAYKQKIGVTEVTDFEGVRSR